MEDSLLFKSNDLYLKINGLFQRCEQILGLNHCECSILSVLYTHKSITQGEISQGFDMPKQTVNNVIKALSKQGYIRFGSSARDKREKVVILTQSGEDYINENLKPFLEFCNRVLERMGEDRVQNMIKGLEDFYFALKLEAEELKKKQREKDMMKEKRSGGVA